MQNAPISSAQHFGAVARTIPFTKEIDEFLMNHQPADRRNVINTLEDALPVDSEHEWGPLVKKFDPKTVLRLIAIITPKKFRDLFLTAQSPILHKQILELVESARSEQFIENLVELFETNQFSDCKDVYDGLVSRFLKALPSAQQEALDSTMDQQLRCLYMRRLSEKDAARIITSRQTLDEQLELLTLCTSARQEQILENIGEEAARNLRAGRLVKLTSAPHKSLNQIHEET